MRFVRIRNNDGVGFGHDDGEAIWELDAAPWCGGKRTGQTLSGPLAAPVAPSKIVCVGRNYQAHAKELGNEVPAQPLLFFKPPSSLLAPHGTIELPPASLSQRVEHEVELGVIMGARARRVSIEQAAATIFGYTVVGDITARDLQRSSKLWTRAKGMDTFCPVGPAVVTAADVTAAAIRCWVDGELRQDGNTAHMVFDPPAIISYISQTMTLEPGDVIATGTPAGVGPLLAGNEVVMEIEGVGRLCVNVGAC